MSDLGNKIPVEIYIAGVCKGNPGAGGWAAILLCKGKIKRLSGAVDYTTSNKIQLIAAYEALNALKKLCAIRFYTNSQYLIQGMDLSRKKRYTDPVWQSLYELAQGHEIAWVPLKRNSHPVQNQAFDLANQKVKHLISSNTEAPGKNNLVQLDMFGGALGHPVIHNQ